MTFKAKTIDEWCEQKFPELTETGEAIENAKKNKDVATLQKELAKNRPLMIHADPESNLVWRPPQIKPVRFERRCLVGKDETPCYFHGWFQLNTPTKDGNSIAYPVGLVEHRDDGVMEQVKVTSIKFVEEFEE